MPSQKAHAITSVHGLGHSWPGAPLFQDLNFTLAPGVAMVVGDEQTGKTTLLKILSGELMPSQGWVETLGLRPDTSAAAYARQVFRTDPLSEALDQTAPDDWFQTLPQRYPAFAQATLNALTEGFGLAPHLAKPMYMLSAGSRRKVWLSAAFASGAPLVLIDQPFAALDAPSIRLLREVLQEFDGQSRRTCVLADYEAPMGVRVSACIHL
jgi:ABC-type multidrug transport system ATPase subunit